MTAHVALIGDYDATVIAHQGIERSLSMARTSMPGLTWQWVHTTDLGTNVAERLSPFSGLWVVPASPYANTDGALEAIRFAREGLRPFLGTCGGFQHALLEYTRNALHLHHAAHAEMAPEAAMPVIAPLRCALVERKGTVHLVSGTRLSAIYGAGSSEEGYHCSYGLNPAYVELFESGPLRVAARDEAGEVRAMELAGHPFFIITLFQPERAALVGRVHPLVEAFVRAAEPQ